ncbi:hypothetical protein PENTCL1PPCAC_4430, partial [Pristionchus entomophagus]
RSPMESDSEVDTSERQPPIAQFSSMENDSDDSVDSSEGHDDVKLICECTKYDPVDEDLDETFSRATDDICWVRPTRLGVPTKCASDDLVTVAVNGAEDIMTLCLDHLEKVNDHEICHNCLTEVVAGTVLVCPSGHNTDPLCNKMKQQVLEGRPRSCSHCGSTDLRHIQLHLDLEDADESHVAEFTKLIEELEKAKAKGVDQPRSMVDHWKARMRAVAPEVLIAYRQAPQSIGNLAARMHPLLPLIDDEEFDLIEKLCDLRGVAKPGDPMSSVSDALESIWHEGDLPFIYTDVVTDPDNLTLIEDEEKAIMFCDCSDACNPAKCKCCTGVYGIDQEGEIHILPEFLQPMSAISECGPACGCRADCGNRLVQKNGGKRYQLEIIDTPNRGKGVRAKEAIPEGRFISEYTGKVREIDNDDVTNKYCFETELGLRRVEIDSRESGSAARCFNHSCEPNAVIVKVAWEPVEERRLFHLAIFALKNIAEAEEITINYGDKFWTESMDEFACLCGSGKCRHDEEKRQEKLRMREEEEMEEDEDDEGDEDEEEPDDGIDDDGEVEVENGKEEEVKVDAVSA